MKNRSYSTEVYAPLTPMQVATLNAPTPELLAEANAECMKHYGHDLQAHADECYGGDLDAAYLDWYAVYYPTEEELPMATVTMTRSIRIPFTSVWVSFPVR